MTIVMLPLFIDKNSLLKIPLLCYNKDGFFSRKISFVNVYQKNKKNPMKLYIKYMVSPRCKTIVNEELRKLNLHHICIDLGMAEIYEDINRQQYENLGKNLSKWGLELIDDKKSILIEKIKNIIIEMFHYSEDFPKMYFSDYISEKLNYDYNYLSNRFMEVKGITIQQFIIMNRVEKVKELLLYHELNLTEIALKLHYSSAAHLSSQFKKITGISPSLYMTRKQKREDVLENQ